MYGTIVSQKTVIYFIKFPLLVDVKSQLTFKFICNLELYNSCK